MKIQRTSPVFQPLTITLESTEEIKTLLNVLYYYNEQGPGAGSDSLESIMCTNIINQTLKGN